MIPDFTEDGTLPKGIHQTTLAEFEERFVYNLKRKIIYEGLKRLIADLKKVHCIIIYVDGSYVTKKALPKDVDVCFEETTGTHYEYEKVNMPSLFNRGMQQRLYNADVFPAYLKESQSKKYFIDFFQNDKATGEPKGILKINI